MKHHIFITVQGGVAEVCEETLPRGVVVEVLDFDNMEGDEVGEMSRWSPDLGEYWERNHKDGGRCIDRCPCGSEAGALIGQDVELLARNLFMKDADGLPISLVHPTRNLASNQGRIAAKIL